MKITIIGNKTDPTKETPTDGGRIRVGLYYNLLKEEGFDVGFIELEGWKKRVFPIIKQMKKAINETDVVLLMGGPNGSRPLIYLCNFFNKKKKTRLVFSMLGIGTIDKKIKNLTAEDAQTFLTGENYFGKKDKKMGRQLSKLDIILVQNNVIASCYRKFYNLDNVRIMINFRKFDNRPALVNSTIEPNKDKKFIFYSRVHDEKGVLEVMETFKKANNENTSAKYLLDIYGPIQLIGQNLVIFKELQNDYITYKGELNNSLVLEVLKNYDFLIFSTKYHGEGTPASLIESFLAGLPVIASNYSQAAELIKEGESGFLFEFNNYDSLYDKIKEAGDMNKKEHNKMKEIAYNVGGNYTYSANRDTFLSYITGERLYKK